MKPIPHTPTAISMATIVLLWCLSAMGATDSITPEAIESLEEVTLLVRISTTDGKPLPVGDPLRLIFAPGTESKILKEVESFRVPKGSDPLRVQGWAAELDRTKTEPEIRAVSLLGGDRVFPVVLLLDDQEKPIARTRPITVKVDALPEVEAPDFQPPLSFAFPWRTVTVTVLILLLVVGLVTWLILRWVARRRALLANVILPPRPLDPEDRVALKALTELELKRLADKRRFKELYFGVSEIAKHYLDRRFDIQATESTREEIVTALRLREVRADWVAETSQLLAAMDLIKFTDFEPPSSEAHALISKVRTWIERTRRTPDAV